MTLRFFTASICVATKLEACIDTQVIYISVTSVFAIHTRCVLEITSPWNERPSGVLLWVHWSSLTIIRLGIFLAGRKNKLYCVCPEAKVWEWACCLNEDGTICHPRKPNEDVSVWMVVLRLIVSFLRVIRVTSVFIAVALVRAVAQKWPFLLTSQACPKLESSSMERLVWEGNFKLRNVPVGIQVLISLLLSATNLTSLSTVRVYIRFMLDYMCSKEDCSSDALPWYLWTETNINFCEL